MDEPARIDAADDDAAVGESADGDDDAVSAELDVLNVGLCNDPRWRDAGST